VGRGFDWPHAINTAFIVGPFDPNLSGAIGAAAVLLKGNIDDGRVAPTPQVERIWQHMPGFRLLLG
jgi:hypothetical protein